jgi:hypothetical protein
MGGRTRQINAILAAAPASRVRRGVENSHLKAVPLSAGLIAAITKANFT